MIDWQDPRTQELSGHTAIFVATLVSGWYLWEFIVSFWFDWAYIRGRLPWRWPLLPYFGSRYAALLATIISMRESNVYAPINCTAWYITSHACAHTAMGLAGMLLILRTLAISGRNIFVASLLGSIWLTKVAWLIKTTVQIRAVYVPELFTCSPLDPRTALPNFAFAWGLDITCVCIVFLFLFRQGSRGEALWKLLVSQGVVYFLVLVVAYLPPTLLLILNLNDGMNAVLQSPALIALVVCATRMHRELVDFVAQGPGGRKHTYPLAPRPSHGTHPSLSHGRVISIGTDGRRTLVGPTDSFGRSKDMTMTLDETDSVASAAAPFRVDAV